MKLLIIGLCVSALAIRAQAHEIGTTQAIATFRADRTYQVDVVVDPDVLLTKLQLAGRVALAQPRVLDERNQMIRSLDGVFLDAITLQFGETRARPAFEYRPASAVSDLVQSPSVVRLTGTIPPGSADVKFGYSLAVGSYALNVRIGDSQVRTFWLDGPSPGSAISLTPPPEQTRGEIAREYFGLGFTHILPKGLDHILFVIGIFLLGTRWRSVLLQVSTFTIAHSITLAASALGFAPNALWFPPLIEVLVAISIVYMAIENIVGARTDRRWMLAFGFGLVHGFAFSFALRESMQFAGAHMAMSLLSFNIGVELGQLFVLALAIPVLVFLFKRVVAERMGTIILSALIAHTAWHWMLDRGAALREYRFEWPAMDAAFLVSVMRASMVAIIAACALWAMSALGRRLSQRDVEREVAK